MGVPVVPAYIVRGVPGVPAYIVSGVPGVPAYLRKPFRVKRRQNTSNFPRCARKVYSVAMGPGGPGLYRTRGPGGPGLYRIWGPGGPGVRWDPRDPRSDHPGR